MKANEILSHLDAVLRFDHDAVGPGPLAPFLDNVNFLLADARMSVFRSDDQWAIFFELFQCIKGYDMEVSIYAYGDCLDDSENPLYGYFRVPFGWPGGTPPVMGEHGISAVERRHFAIMFNGRRLEFRPTEEEYAAAGITAEEFADLPGAMSYTQLLRYLCHAMDHPFFASEDYLRYLLDECRPDGAPLLAHQMKLFLQTREWRHPDIVANEPPSTVECFQVLARALETDDLAEWRRLDPATFNTDWRCWREWEREMLRGPRHPPFVEMSSEEWAHAQAILAGMQPDDPAADSVNVVGITFWRPDAPSPPADGPPAK